MYKTRNQAYKVWKLNSNLSSYSKGYWFLATIISAFTLCVCRQLIYTSKSINYTFIMKNKSVEGIDACWLRFNREFRFWHLVIISDKLIIRKIGLYISYSCLIKWTRYYVCDILIDILSISSIQYLWFFQFITNLFWIRMIYIKCTFNRTKTIL